MLLLITCLPLVSYLTTARVTASLFHWFNAKFQQIMGKRNKLMMRSAYRPKIIDCKFTALLSPEPFFPTLIAFLPYFSRCCTVVAIFEINALTWHVDKTFCDYLLNFLILLNFEGRYFILYILTNILYKTTKHFNH